LPEGHAGERHHESCQKESSHIGSSNEPERVNLDSAISLARGDLAGPGVPPTPPFPAAFAYFGIRVHPPHFF
jgi:hypothetical protein